MHVLVTGGAGFIGSHIVEYHLNNGDQVLAVDDLSSGSRDNLAHFVDHPGFRFEEADILIWKEIEKSCEWADRIYHMAAVVGVFKVLSEPIKVLAVNIAGAERLLRAVSAGKWNPDLVMASTSEVYGNRSLYDLSRASDREDSRLCLSSLQPCREAKDGDKHIELCEDMELIVSSSLDARSNYSVSKLADELFGLTYARQHNLKVRMIRFFNVVGARQTGRYGMVLPRFVKQAVDGEPITVYGDGTQTRCFMDARDVVVALDLLASTPNSVGRVVNLGAKRDISVLELAKLVKKSAGSDSEITFTSYEEAYGEGFSEIYHRRPCLKRLHSLIDFTPRWTLEQTVEDLIHKRREWVATPKAQGTATFDFRPTFKE